MIGGLSAVVLVFLTWRYVRINAGLLRVNQETLQELRDYVAATKEIAALTGRQAALLTADANRAIAAALQPFRSLLLRMLAGLQVLLRTDLMNAYSGDASKRPQTSAFLPPDFLELTQRARDVDSDLHARLSKLIEPEGGVTTLQVALGRLAHEYDERMNEWKSRESAEQLANDVQKAAGIAYGEVSELFLYLDELAERLRSSK